MELDCRCYLHICVISILNHFSGIHLCSVKFISSHRIHIITKLFGFSVLADLLLNELIPRIVKHIHDVVMSNIHSAIADVFESNPNSKFWLKIMETIKDNYAVERISEQLLHQLAATCESDVDAYWVLWLLFHRSLRLRMSVRSVIKIHRSNSCVPHLRRKKNHIRYVFKSMHLMVVLRVIMCTVSCIN